jgi:hypothetical protein
MNEKFSRRHFFKNFLRHIGEASTETLRSYNLEDTVNLSEEVLVNKRPARRTESETLAVTTTRPKKLL